MTRLGFLRMLGMTTMARYGSMGQAHRRPDQMSDPPPSAVAPTQAAGILRARAVVIFGTGPTAGLFVYNGTPALGNPPQIAIVPTGVTKDPFGNLIGTSKILMQGNVITESGGIFRTAASAPLIQLDGPHNAELFYDAGVHLADSVAPVATTDGLGNTIQSDFTAYGSTNNTYAQVSGGIIKIFSGGFQSLASQMSISGGAGISSQLNVTSGAGTEAGATGSTLLLGDSGAGIGLQAIDGRDGNTYDTERITVRLTTDFTINSTTPQTIMSHAVGIGTYEVEVWLVTQNATAADAAGFAFTVPASTGLIDCKFTTSGVSATTNYAASTTVTASFSGIGSGGNQQVHMMATIKFTAAGTLALTGKELVAGNTINVSTGSRMRLCPVVAT